jgi:hypothetical protein
MAQIAFMTLAIMRDPTDSPSMQSFFDQAGPNFEAATRADGFIAMSEDGRPEWGSITGPRFAIKDEYMGRHVITLSVWADLESVFAYAYNGSHGDSLSQRKAWFEPPAYPAYVAWWIEDDIIPTWQEGSDRLDSLYEDGPLPNAFNFGHPFDAEGNPTTIDREMARRKAKGMTS